MDAPCGIPFGPNLTAQFLLEVAHEPSMEYRLENPGGETYRGVFSHEENGH